MHGAYEIICIDICADHNFLDCLRLNPFGEILISCTCHIGCITTVRWVIRTSVKVKTEYRRHWCIPVSLYNKGISVRTVKVLNAEIFYFISIRIKDVSTGFTFWVIYGVNFIVTIDTTICRVLHYRNNLLYENKLAILWFIHWPVSIPVRKHKC